MYVQSSTKENCTYNVHIHHFITRLGDFHDIDFKRTFSMKIKTISRTEEDFCRKSKLDISKVHRNRDPALHPFDRSREYAKAVVATKLDKIFAKPFVGNLDGHIDGVYCMSTIRNKIVPLISGACDGEI